MKLTCKVGAALTAAGLLCWAGAASADCKLAEIAEFHVDAGGASPVVDGEINGQPVKILFDTGASTSMVPLNQAKRLGLVLGSPNGSRMYGIGGNTAVYDTTLKELKIGDFKTGNLNLLVAGDADAKWGVSLILGDDFFSRTDVEFDLRDGVVRLFEPHGCTPPQLVYWGQAYSQATILPWDRDNPSTQTMATIDGRQILAEFDTGFNVSTVDEAAAEAAGVHPENASGGSMVRGVGPSPTRGWLAHLDSLALGDEKLSNVRLQVVNFAGGMSEQETGFKTPRQLSNTPYLFVGADFFHAHRVFIDNKDRLILFSYEGGPVFRADEPPQPAGR